MLCILSSFIPYQPWNWGAVTWISACEATEQLELLDHTTSKQVWGQIRSKLLSCLWNNSLAWMKNKLLSLVAHSEQHTWKTWRVHSWANRTLVNSLKILCMQQPADNYFRFCFVGTWGHWPLQSAGGNSIKGAPETPFQLIKVLFLRSYQVYVSVLESSFSSRNTAFYMLDPSVLAVLWQTGSSHLGRALLTEWGTNTLKGTCPHGRLTLLTLSKSLEKSGSKG